MLTLLTMDAIGVIIFTLGFGCLLAFILVFCPMVLLCEFIKDKLEERRNKKC